MSEWVSGLLSNWRLTASILASTPSEGLQVKVVSRLLCHLGHGNGFWAFVPHDAPVRPASGPKQSMGPVTAPPPVGPGGMRAGPIGTVVGPPTLSPMAPQPMSTGTGYTMMGAAMPGSSTKNDIHCTDEPMKPPPGPMTPPEGVKHNVAGPVAPEPASAESLSSSRESTIDVSRTTRSSKTWISITTTGFESSSDRTNMWHSTLNRDF